MLINELKINPKQTMDSSLRGINRFTQIN